MGEIKSVKVDNWGVFFLQKLQNFFNKTDYCDLTLQFRDNSQLKVHRLVLSACTDYFNVLEQTCEVVDDAIIMPNGLQADVVVPIVNFMYTGTLEFELKMYNRLLRTAKDMNMTVLLKLLEAHRRTMEMHPQKASGQASPKPRRRTAGTMAPANTTNNAGGRSLIQTNQGKRLVVGSNLNATQNRSVTTGNTLTRFPSAGPVRQIGSTTFTRIKVENETQDINTSNSASGGYSLIKYPSQQQQQQQPTSPFEQLRKGYNSNKRPAVSTFVSPPAKKPNLEDVKEFAEQQRVRKQIAAEYGDYDYDASNILDDDTIHNDDDDDELMTTSGQTQTSQTASAGVQTVASSQQQQQDPPGTTTIIVKHEGPDKPPTIVVKDSSNSKMNHTKIISEVLRQYPHLVKGNKNIKLKIMPNAGGQAQKIIVKKEVMETEKQACNKQGGGTKVIVNPQQRSMKTLVSNIVANRPKNIQQQQAEASAVDKAITANQADVSKPTATAGSSTTPATPGQPIKRRIDSKTMHALIALGAENTTGPWLCLRCGRNGHPISIPSYRGFRRHLINTHKEVIDAALCEHCGWRSSSKRELHFHMQLEHKVKTNLYIFPECQLCQQMCIDSDGLNQHLIESHPDENKQQCIYCNKIFPEEIQLYTHMKTFHKKQALEDGIIDYSDDEIQTQMNLPPLPNVEYDKEIESETKPEQPQAKKIKIISDISLPIASSIIKTDSFVQQQESTTSAASEEYLQDHEQDQDNTETKFVAADGSEVILTAEQRKEILSQLNQEHEGSAVVMVLNENQHDQDGGSGDTQSDHGAISHDETSQATTATNEERDEDDEEDRVAEEDDQHDDNQIYTEMKSLNSNIEEDSISQTDTAAEATNTMQEEQEETEHDQRSEHLEESKESIDNLEWAENLISEHELADEVSSQTANENSHNNKSVEKEVETKEDDKSQDEISKKLKELTGDWSEDDDEDEEPVGEMSQTKDNVNKKEEISEEVERKSNDMEVPVKEQLENSDFDDHSELLASLSSADKDETDQHKKPVESVTADSENIDEDDIDIALKSLHKEEIEDDATITEEKEEKEIFSKDESEETKRNNLIESSKEKHFEDGIEETPNSVKPKEEKADEDKTEEEKCATELGTMHEPGATSEVGVKTEKDIIDGLLTEQAESAELESTTETTKTTLKLDPESSLDEQQSKEDIEAKAKLGSNSDIINDEFENNEEFLDATPETKRSLADSTAITTTSDIVSTQEAANASSGGIKEQTILSSEERVKSLISEWGDDDEDDDDNDADLPANL